MIAMETAVSVFAQNYLAFSNMRKAIFLISMSQFSWYSVKKMYTWCILRNMPQVIKTKKQ